MIEIKNIIVSTLFPGSELRLEVSHIQDNRLDRELFIEGSGQVSYWFRTIQISETTDILELIDSKSTDYLWKRSVEFIRQELSNGRMMFTEEI